MSQMTTHKPGSSASTGIPPELYRIRSLLREQGYDLRIIGGFVRDFVRGDPYVDIDLLSDAPSEMIRRAVIETGCEITRDVGFLITLQVAGDLHVDVVSCFHDLRMPEDDPWIHNLKTRDFTMNAMAMTFEGEILDPCGGYDDAMDGRVRFCDHFSEVISVDPVRIIRYVRFLARFKTPQPDICLEAFALASFEMRFRTDKARIAKELLALKNSPNSEIGFDMLERYRVFPALRNAFSGKTLPAGIPEEVMATSMTL